MHEIEPVMPAAQSVSPAPAPAVAAGAPFAVIIARRQDSKPSADLDLLPLPPPSGVAAQLFAGQNMVPETNSTPHTLVAMFQDDLPGSFTF